MIEHRLSGFAYCAAHGFYGAPTPQIFMTERDAKAFAAIWHPEVHAQYKLIPVTLVGHPDAVSRPPNPSEVAGK